MVARGFVRYAWGTLAYTVGVILWGAFVRATGSGAGCANNWPLCNGEVIPRPERIETLIEFTHRATSGIAFLLVVGMAIWAFRRFARGHRVRWASGLAVVFMIAEALIGAGLVLFELVADNASIARAYWMAGHLLNTFFLLATLTLTAWWSTHDRPLAVRQSGGWAVGLGVALFGMVLTSTSGAVTALGDTLYRLGETEPSATAELLIGLRSIHPILAIGASVVVLVIVMAAAQARSSALAQRLSRWIAGGLIGQLGLGALNVALSAPVWMQLAHLLVADLVWIGLIVFAATALATTAPTAATDGTDDIRASEPPPDAASPEAAPRS